MSTIEVAGVPYNREESEHLRQRIIDLRNGALEQNSFDWAVTLSHVIGWMAVMMEEKWPISHTDE